MIGKRYITQLYTTKKLPIMATNPTICMCKNASDKTFFRPHRDPGRAACVLSFLFSRRLEGGQVLPR